MKHLSDTVECVPVVNDRGDVRFERPDVAECVEATLRAYRERKRQPQQPEEQKQ